MDAFTQPSPTLLQAILDDSAARHKHLCPRQVLGARLGLAGLLALGLPNVYDERFDNGRKHLLTIVETDGCAADGISAATDCYVGRRTMRVLDFGKVAATLVDTRTGTAVRVSPQLETRSAAGRYAPLARSRWHSYLEAYQIMPDAELVRVQPVELTQTLAEIISRPNLRVACAVCGEEIINEREVVVNGRSLCRSCAGDAYYRV